MLVLVLDTATPAITAGLAEVGEAAVTVRAERVTVSGRAHGELLAPSIEAVLREGGASVHHLSAIVAGLGPGPFTGLRAGLVTAAMMSSALSIPAYGVCTLDGLGAATTGDIVVATDARRREVYWAFYRDGSRTTGPAVSKPADLATRLGAIVAGVGAGAEKYADVLGIAAGEPHYPPVVELARLAARRVLAKAPGEVLTPLYLRRPDAAEPSTRKPALAAGER